MDQGFILGCQSHWFCFAGIGLIGGQDAVGRVRPLGVVILQPFPDARLRLGAFLKGMQVHTFVFQRPPQKFDHAIVDPAALAIHADLDLRVAQHVDPVTAGELAAII